MDEPTSALDPASTAKIEDLMSGAEEGHDHRHRDPQHASGGPGQRHHRVFLVGDLVEHGVTDQVFTSPRDERTEAYVTGRFG